MSTTTTEARTEGETQEPQAQCGQMSANLWWLGIDHEPCSREDGHKGFCFHIALGPLA